MAKEIGVYYQNQSSESEPSYFVDVKEARRLKAENKGFFINHGKAIRLLESAFSPPVSEDKQKSQWQVRMSGCMLLQMAPVAVLQLI